MSATITGPGLPPPHRPYEALSLPSFRRYLAGLLFITLAWGVQAVVVSWQVYELTGDEYALGLVGLCEFIPSFLVTPIAGNLADRKCRRRLALLGSLGLLAASLALLAVAVMSRGSGPNDDGPMHAQRIYLILIVAGLFRGLTTPARSALGSEVVPRAMLATAISLRTSMWQIGAVLGPALGGLAYKFGGAPSSYLLDAVLIVAAAFSFALIRVAPKPPVEVPANESFFAGIVEGWRCLRERKEILAALTLDLVAVLFGGAVALLPVFAKDILHAGPGTLGLLRSAPSLGAVAVALVITHLPPFERAGRAMIIAIIGFGLATIGFALSKDVWVSAFFLAMTGACDYVSVVVRHTLVQVRTPPHMLGRVTALNALFIGSSNELGAYESGLAARLMGTIPSVIFGGCMTLLSAVVAFVACPPLRRLGRLRDVDSGRNDD